MSAELRFWKSVDDLRADRAAQPATRDCFAGQRAGSLEGLFAAVAGADAQHVLDA